VEESILKFRRPFNSAPQRKKNSRFFAAFDLGHFCQLRESGEKLDEPAKKS